MNERKINVLIVDDEEQFLKSTSKILNTRGFHVIAVNRGDKAIEAAQNNAVDIALVDLKMPGMNGEETLQMLKKEHPLMEIIIFTGHGSIDSAVSCTKEGAYTYLQKPCEMDILIDTLKNAYQKNINNKDESDQRKRDEMLKISMSSSPKGILERIKQLDESKGV